MKAGRLSFTDRPDEPPWRGADAVFIAVGTPSRRGDGHADLTYVFAAAEEIAAGPRRLYRHRHQIDRAGRHQPQGRRDHPQDAAGCAVRRGLQPGIPARRLGDRGFPRPDRVVVGTESERARAVMKEVYRPLYLNETPILFTGRAKRPS